MFYLRLEANIEETCNMIVVNNNNIPNKKIIESLGIVQGSTVRARNVARDIFAKIKTLIGGEISEYTNLQNSARQQAIDRMIIEAKNKNADAIINVRITTSMVMQGCSEILAYGTAVKLSDLSLIHI